MSSWNSTGVMRDARLLQIRQRLVVEPLLVALEPVESLLQDADLHGA